MNDTTKKEIRERWEKTIDINSFYSCAEADKYLGSDKNLIFRDHCYPESEVELDADKVADWWLAELSRLDQERVEKVRGMNKNMIKSGDPLSALAEGLIDKGYNTALQDVLTNVFNVEK